MMVVETDPTVTASSPKPPTNGALAAVEDHDLYEALQHSSPTEVATLFGVKARAVYDRRQTATYKRVAAAMRRDVEDTIHSHAAADMQLVRDTCIDILQNGIEDHAKLQASRLLAQLHDNGKAPEVERIEELPTEDRSSLLERVKDATASALVTQATDRAKREGARAEQEPAN
jgi:hypothetical protein